MLVSNAVQLPKKNDLFFAKIFMTIISKSNNKSLKTDINSSINKEFHP